MFRRLREYFATRQQSSIMVNLISMWEANRPLADIWDVNQFTQDGYRRNTLIFACVTEIATSFAHPELCAYQETADGDDEELPREHLLSQLLAHPNKRQSQAAFLRALSTHLEVAGNAYIWKRRSSAGLPVELHLLRPDAVKIIPDANGLVVGYQYGNAPDAQNMAAEDVIHEIGNPDPLDTFRGLSPIAVLARMGDLDNFAGDYLRAFFLNAGIPSGLLKYKSQVPKTERDRVKQAWKDQYSGTKGWWDVGVIDADVEYQEIGSKLRTMDLEGVFGQTETRICQSFGVPPILIGSWIGLLRSSYANYDSARKSFYQETLAPKWSSLSSRLTMELASEFGDNLGIEFDLSSVDAMQEDQAPIREFALNAWEQGLATKNEARQMLGWDPDAGGDIYKLKTTDVMQPAALEGMRRGPVTEILMLPSGPRERMDTLLEAEWKALQDVADASAPEVKKKFSRRLPRRRTRRLLPR